VISKDLEKVISEINRVPQEESKLASRGSELLMDELKSVLNLNIDSINLTDHIPPLVWNVFTYNEISHSIMTILVNNKYSTPKMLLDSKFKSLYDQEW